METGKYVTGSLWFYAPNKVTPAIFSVLFALSTTIHLWQCFHYKCFKVTGILPFTGLVFVAGYVLREVGAFHFSNVKIFISSVVMLYAAPPLFELSNYLTLSRSLYYVPYHSPIHPGRVLTTFAALSGIVEALNGNGAARVANSTIPQSLQNVGRGLLKAALVLQLVILFLFLLLAGYFHYKCSKAKLLPQNLKAVLITLYCSSALIGTRTIYRNVEYFSTASIHFTKDLDPSTLSPILRYEWFFWVFEASLMITNSFLLNIRHPMRYLPSNNKIYLAEDGVTEVHGPGYEDVRMWIITVIDPFDIIGMIKGRNMNQKFWETHEVGRVPELQVIPAPRNDVEKGSNGRV